MSKKLITEDELRKVSPQREIVLKLKTNYPHKGTNLEVETTFYSLTEDEASDLQNGSAKLRFITADGNKSYYTTQ